MSKTKSRTRKKYRVNVPSLHHKIRDDQRVNKAKPWGSRTKYKIAFVARNRKKGKIFQVFVDPRSTKQGSDTLLFDSTEAYELTLNQVNSINQFMLAEHDSNTAASILSFPANKVGFRWIPRETLREIRRMAHKNKKLVLTS